MRTVPLTGHMLLPSPLHSLPQSAELCYGLYSCPSSSPSVHFNVYAPCPDLSLNGLTSYFALSSPPSIPVIL
ncbi:hypothetical protein BDQ94DRAFT_151969 [Aspergillus welwitschiae]|uniref:Uncharacterized protein n=1 Tax=Aspergillus welwitschiae TaxID=1341132 RepID=A0A3F3PNL2_9EURO|nr:hypothetical protein BDQ94DRAFT_151969 [Aspergillus welwitschiae]RDH28428.1 hypothetical protein BDQ94DRAFT_151969 [Aspergillus welwitschiae]